MRKKQRITTKEKIELDATFIDDQGKPRQPVLLITTDLFSREIVGYTLIHPGEKVTRIHTQHIKEDS